MSNKINRRDFLKNSAKIAAGTSVIANSAKSQIIKEAPKVETDGYDLSPLFHTTIKLGLT